ncbi:MAG: cob(I)yrinic acid a,c-diamide adenosyltransferase [Spirochaetota bacterium]
MIIIFTGNGKGKTTAALGQAVRALGRGKRVLIIQFIKNIESGEHLFFKKIQAAGFKTKIKIIPAGKGFVKILGDKFPLSEHKKAANNALKLAKKEILSGKWDLVILDEINVAVSLKLIKAVDVLNIINPRESTLCPHKSVFVLTGRGAPKNFIQKADLVTEMKEIKHPFKKGAQAQIGVEF